MVWYITTHALWWRPRTTLQMQATVGGKDMWQRVTQRRVAAPPSMPATPTNKGSQADVVVRQWRTVTESLLHKSQHKDRARARRSSMGPVADKLTAPGLERHFEARRRSLVRATIDVPIVDLDPPSTGPATRKTGRGSVPASLPSDKARTRKRRRSKAEPR